MTRFLALLGLKCQQMIKRVLEACVADDRGGYAGTAPSHHIGILRYGILPDAYAQTSLDARR